MCGIGGWISFGEGRPPRGFVEKLLEELTPRGMMASGVAWVPSWGGNTTILKAALPGTRLLKTKVGAGYLDEISAAGIGIVHTRMPTKGTAANNKNNHPVFRSGGRYVLVHNGCIANDDSLFETLTGKESESRQAEVDTEALVFLLDKGSTIEESRKWLERAVGSYAIAALPQKDVDHVLLLRYTSPLALLLDDNAEILYFASTEAALGKVFSKLWPSKLAEKLCIEGISNAPAAVTVKDDHYIVFGPQGYVDSGTHRPNCQLAPSRIVPPVTSYSRFWEPGDDVSHGGGVGRPGRPELGFTSETSVRGKNVKIKDYRGLLPPQSQESVNIRALPSLKGLHTNIVRIKCPGCWTFVALQEVKERSNRCPVCTTQFEEK